MNETKQPESCCLCSCMRDLDGIVDKGCGAGRFRTSSRVAVVRSYRQEFRGDRETIYIYRNGFLQVRSREVMGGTRGGKLSMR